MKKDILRDTIMFQFPDILEVFNQLRKEDFASRTEANELVITYVSGDENNKKKFMYEDNEVVYSDGLEYACITVPIDAPVNMDYDANMVTVGEGDNERYLKLYNIYRVADNAGNAEIITEFGTLMHIFNIDSGEIVEALDEITAVATNFVTLH